MVETLFFADGMVVSGGMDGRICYWDYEVLRSTDISNSAVLEMEPVNELVVGNGVEIRGMIRGEGGHWLVQDARGGLWRVDLGAGAATPKKLITFHAGRLVGLDTCPLEHFAVSAGDDGSVRLYDYVARVQVCSSRFSAGASALCWLSTAVDASGRSILVGFADGTVRLLLRCADGLKLKQVCGSACGCVGV